MLMTMPKSFEWTSLQINYNTVSDPHRDYNNHGSSLIFLLGDFVDGEFQMTDGSLSVAESGAIYLFQGAAEHCSKPFTGERISVVAFNHSKASTLSLADRDTLAGMGFRSALLAGCNIKTTTIHNTTHVASTEEILPSDTESVVDGGDE